MRRDFLPWHHHPAHPQVCAPVRVDPTGRYGPTPSSARRGRWRRVAPGWVVPVEVDGSATDQRIVEAAVRLTSYGAVTGWAALHWQGARWFDRPDPVPLAIGDAGLRPTASIIVSEEQVLPHHLIVVDGLRITTAVSSTLFEMRRAFDELSAITVLDMACYDDLVAVAEVSAGVVELGPRTGVPLVRRAVAQSDENAWSPPEVASRQIWTRAGGLPRPLTNVPIFDRNGSHVLTPDLIDPAAGVVGEYDGAGHRDRGQQAGDVRRDDLYRRLGLEQVTMTAPDLVEPQPAVARLAGAYQRARARPATDRPWTLTPPSWWTPTDTVVRRRTLAPAQRTRLLRYRCP